MLVVGLACAGMACSTTRTEDQEQQLSSPDGDLVVAVAVTADKKAFYTVKHKGVEVLQASELGVVMEDQNFSEGLELESVSDIEPVQDSYTLLHGKQKDYSYSGNKQVYHLKNVAGARMDVIFQVSNDGVAFRYYFPEGGAGLKKITEEVSAFHFPEGTKAWMQPLADAKSGWGLTNPSYEEFYLQDIPVGTPSPNSAGWAFPALFKYNETWMLVSETNLDRTYCATRLRQEAADGVYRIGFPQEKEVMPNGELNPQSELPWYSPWRLIAIGNLATVVESTLGTDLAAPAIDMDTDWVKPGRASWSWVLLKDNNTVFDVQKQFIDYAADMGWEYCLIDAEWDKQIGYEKIQELVNYGKTKNVGIILWYNSSGDWNTTHQTPKNLMVTHESRLAEFKRIAGMGVKGVKIDFFGGDGQSVIRYYHDILQDAAEAKIIVNFHGATLPRGWQRTYPHLVTVEAVRGMEYTTFEQPDADAVANHSAMLPFTRNVFDPMDFTPTAFSEIPDKKRITSNAFELALPVLFTSGIQHYAEVPAGMAKVPDYVQQLMRDIPVVWDESRFVDGIPGKHVVMARRSGNTWYIAGINGEATAKNIQFALPFIKANTAQLVTDGATNRSFQQRQVELSGEDKVTNLSLSPNGGFVFKVEE